MRAMTAVMEHGATLGDALPRETAALPVEEAARAGRLATEALRWANRSDRLLGPHLRMKPEDPVMNALRLALYEINEDGAPGHAAINAAVSLVIKPKAGLVNAVLRNVQRRGTVWSDLPVPGMPKWLRKKLVKAWGKEAVSAMEAVHALQPPLDLTAKGSPLDLASAVGGEVLPTGSIRLHEFGRVSALPGFDDGLFWVQDAAAALPVKCLGEVSGKRVLDLCAAPGGKTMQLAAAGAEVTALDVSETRLARLRDNLRRTNLEAEVVVADALKWEPKEKFDAILLDAPCSATGTLRRHPDLGFAKDGSELETLLPLQAAMIGRATGWLKPGGTLVYCTCSLLPEEGEEQLAKALNRHSDLTLLNDLPEGADPDWVAKDGGLRIRPDYWAERGGLDGFFIAALRKSA